MQRRWLLAVALLVGFAELASADTGILVRRRVNLRPDPSTSHPPIRTIDVGETAALLDTLQVDRFWHVRTEAGEEGWVWSRNVKVVPGEEEGAPVVISDITGAPLANSISKSWEKHEPHAGNYTMKSGHKCGPSGSAGSDKVTNLRKNRTDTPESAGMPPHAVSFKAVLGLPDPDVHATSRVNWTANDEGTLEEFEGTPIQLIGFIVAYKPQKGSASHPGEACNCGATNTADLDVHIALAEKAGQGEEKAIVVETTPRIRRHHAKWSKAALDDWIESPLPVRVTGWLMYDPEHRAMMETFRMSMWEIHPVTRIEVWDNSHWVDADALP